MTSLPQNDLRAALRLVDESESEAEGWLDDEDDAAMIAAELDRLEERMLFLAKRLEKVRAGLACARDHGDREAALAGA